MVSLYKKRIPYFYKEDSMTELYRCDKCQKIYTSPDDAVLCEMMDCGWEEGVAKILACGLDPCDFCKEQYYVYGCEPDCKYRKECNVHNKFKNFERKNKNG